MWAVKWSFIALFITAGLQLVVVILSHSVALFADTIHNFGYAATGIPLAIAFAFAKRHSTADCPSATHGSRTSLDVGGPLKPSSRLAAGIELIRVICLEGKEFGV